MNIVHVLKIPSVIVIMLADMRNPKALSDLTFVPKHLIFNWLKDMKNVYTDLNHIFSIELKCNQHLPCVKLYYLLEETQLFKYLANKQPKMISV